MQFSQVKTEQFSPQQQSSDYNHSLLSSMKKNQMIRAGSRLRTDSMSKASPFQLKLNKLQMLDRQQNQSSLGLSNFEKSDYSQNLQSSEAPRGNFQHFDEIRGRSNGSQTQMTDYKKIAQNMRNRMQEVQLRLRSPIDCDNNSDNTKNVQVESLTLPSIKTPKQSLQPLSLLFSTAVKQSKHQSIQSNESSDSTANDQMQFRGSINGDMARSSSALDNPEHQESLFPSIISISNTTASNQKYSCFKPSAKKGSNLGGHHLSIENLTHQSTNRSYSVRSLNLNSQFDLVRQSGTIVTGEQSLNNTTSVASNGNGRIPVTEIGIVTHTGKQAFGTNKINQDAFINIKNFFEQINSELDMPKYQLHMLCDGHGQYGHQISNYIIEQFPQLLSRRLHKVLEEFKALEKQAKYELQQIPDTIVEVDDEDASPRIREGSFERMERISNSQCHQFQDRWELKKKKQSLIKKALSDSFLEMQAQISQQRHMFNPDLSGSTLTIVLITDENNIFTAGVGDSMAFLVQYDKTAKAEKIRRKLRRTLEEQIDDDDDFNIQEYSIIPLTQEHRPNMSREIKRIYRSGGEVKASKAPVTQRSKSISRLKPSQLLGRSRVWVQGQDTPGLAIARSLGDEIGHSVGVISEPDITAHKLDVDRYQYSLILASDGLWNVVSPTLIKGIVKEQTVKQLAGIVPQSENSAVEMDELLLNTAQLITDQISTQALENWSKKTEQSLSKAQDDMTIMVVRMI